MSKRTVMVGAFGIAFLALALVVGWWLAGYWAGLHPRLVLTLPKEKCHSLHFKPDGLTYGPRVEKLCRENGVSQTPVFAILGRTVVRLTDTSHLRYGCFETAEADAATVYFYQYDENDLRYLDTLTEP